MRAEVRFFKNGCNEGWKIFARNKAGGREGECNEGGGGVEDEKFLECL